MSTRTRLTRLLLWISVLAWGIILGGKLFDLRVLAGAWSANPPESLSLLPYGSRYPVDTGEYFFPASVALLVSSFGALISGWKTPTSYRIWLLLPPLLLLVMLVFTVLWFWPRNAALWAIATGAPDAVQDPAEILRMTRQWVRYDWIRIAVGSVAFVSVLRAFSMPFPPAASRSERRATTASRS